MRLGGLAHPPGKAEPRHRTKGPQNRPAPNLRQIPMPGRPPRPPNSTSAALANPRNRHMFARQSGGNVTRCMGELRWMPGCFDFYRRAGHLSLDGVIRHSEMWQRQDRQKEESRGCCAVRATAIVQPMRLSRGPFAPLHSPGSLLALSIYDPRFRPSLLPSPHTPTDPQRATSHFPFRSLPPAAPESGTHDLGPSLLQPTAHSPLSPVPLSPVPSRPMADPTCTIACPLLPLYSAPRRASPCLRCAMTEWTCIVR
jgi:hypothetical protein